MSFSKISSERVVVRSLIVTMLFLIIICKENGAIETDADNDEESTIDESANGDEDDEKDLNFPLGEETATYGALTLSPTMKRDRCNEDQIMIYLSKLEVINPEMIVQIASSKDLDQLCREVGTILKSVDAFLLTCNPLPPTNLYMQLTTGVRVLHNKLCTHSDYQLGFKNYMACYQELHNEYIDCAGPADWTENMEAEELCKEYKLIADCYYIQTARLCGVKAATILKELVVKVINAVIEAACPEINENPLVPDPMPEHSVYARKSSSSMVLADSRVYTLPIVRYLFILIGRLLY